VEFEGSFPRTCHWTLFWGSWILCIFRSD